MYLCITGFQPDEAEDDSLQFELDVDSVYNDEIVQLLGHKSLNAMAEGLWPLSPEQVARLSALIGQTIPTELDILIGVEG